VEGTSCRLLQCDVSIISILAVGFFSGPLCYAMDCRPVLYLARATMRKIERVGLGPLLHEPQGVEEQVYRWCSSVVFRQDAMWTYAG
jgi:hypothetical protein